MAKREYMEAAKTAVIIAQEEQISGKKVKLIHLNFEKLEFQIFFNVNRKLPPSSRYFIHHVLRIEAERFESQL